MLRKFLVFLDNLFVLPRVKIDMSERNIVKQRNDLQVLTVATYITGYTKFLME